MLSFLSDEWIAALDAAGSANSADRTRQLAGAPVLTILQQITSSDPSDGGDKRGDTTYAVLVYADEVRVKSGSVDDADVTFVIDRDTAAAIAQGQVSAQAAFMSGDLQLIGETSALIRAQGALEDLADRFAAVRADTDW